MVTENTSQYKLKKLTCTHNNYKHTFLVSYIHFWELKNIESLNILPPPPPLSKLKDTYSTCIKKNLKWFHSFFNTENTLKIYSSTQSNYQYWKNVCGQKNAQFCDNFSDGTLWSWSTYKHHTTCSYVLFFAMKNIQWWHGILTSIYMKISEQLYSLKW